MRRVFGMGLICAVIINLGCGHSDKPASGTSCAAGSGTIIDQYQLSPSVRATPVAIAVTPSGGIFVAGRAQDSAAATHWIVRNSADNGATWKTSDNYMGPDGNGAYGVTAITADLAGTLYVVGYSSSGSSLHWISRRSSDGGSTWTTVDDYAYPGQASITQPFAIAVDTHGLVYVAGGANYFGKSPRFLLRKSTDGGSTWSTVSDRTDTRAGQYLTVDPQGNLFVTGSYLLLSTPGWTVQKSTDGGSTFSTVDSYGNVATLPYGITVDRGGDVLVFGSGYSSASNLANQEPWIVRKGTSTGATWTTSDQFQSPATSTEPVSMAVASDGTLFLLGSESLGFTMADWMIRSTSASEAGWSNRECFSGPGKLGSPTAIAVQDSHVFAVGITVDGSQQPQWTMVRF